MSGDKFDQLYNALKADGAVSGTRENFKKYVYAPGKQGYQNRKQLYDALHADGAVSSGSYKEFAQRLGLHATKQQKQPKQQVSKPQTAAQMAMSQGYKSPQNWEKQKVDVDYLRGTQRIANKPLKSAPKNASPFVQSLYAADDEKRENDNFLATYELHSSTRGAKSLLGENRSIDELHAKDAADMIVNNETRRRNQPIVKTETPADDYVVKTQGQLEDEMQQSANEFVDTNLGDFVSKAVLDEQNAASERALAAADLVPTPAGGAGGMGLLVKGMAYNKEVDPDLMAKNLLTGLENKMQNIFSNPEFAKKMQDEAARLGVPLDAYVSSIVPSLQNKLVSSLNESEFQKALPKNMFDNVVNRFINSNTIGKLLRLATQTKGQRVMNEQAMAATEAGENPYYKGGMVENVASDIAGMVADPVFGASAKAGGAVAGKLLGNSTKMAAIMANGNLAQRLTAKGVQAVTSGGVTGFVFDSTGGVIQNYSTGEDTSLGNTLKVAAKRGVSGAVNFSTMSLAGLPLGELGRSIGFTGVKGGSLWGNAGKATAKIGLEAGKTYMEAMGMYLGGYASSKLEGATDANGKPIEFDLWGGTMESLPTAIGFRIQHAIGGLKGGRKNAKGEDIGWLGSTVVNFKDFLTSDKAKVSRFMMTDEEKNQIFTSGANLGLKSNGENIVDYAKRTKGYKVSEKELSEDGSDLLNYYQQIINDPKVSWDAKAKFSAMVAGVMPEARPMYDHYAVGTEEGTDSDGIHTYKTVNEYAKDGTLLSKQRYDTRDQRESIIYNLQIKGENRRLNNAVALLVAQDRNNYDLQNAFFKEKATDWEQVQEIVDGMNTEGSAIDNEFTNFVRNAENGRTIPVFDAVAKESGMERKDLIAAYNKDPLKRTDAEQNACIQLRHALEDVAFPKDKVHEEQSHLQGKDVAEDNGLGTEKPNGEAVKQELNNLSEAENELEQFMKDNDVFGQNFENLQKQGLTNPQIYGWMLDNGLTEEQLAPFAHYINANARVQGMQNATQQMIEQKVSAYVQDWSLHGTLNGQEAKGEQVVWVQDKSGRTLVVGSGEMAFDSTNGRAKEGVGDMLVCLDPNTGDVVYTKVDDVTFFQTQKPEDFGNEYRNKLQQINSQAYNEAAQEQAAKNETASQHALENGANADTNGVNHGQENGATVTSVNSPAVSSGKGTENNPSVQENPELYKVANSLQGKIGQSLSKEEAEGLVAEMEGRAEPARELELTPENWTAEFGEDGKVATPLGEVKMGENQYFKLAKEGRNGKLGLIKPTLENPDVIIEDASQAKEGQVTERPSSYLFVKAFTGKDGSRVYYFTSVTVSRDGKEVVVSNQERRAKRIATVMESGKILYLKGNQSASVAQSEKSVPLGDSNSSTTTDSQGALHGINSPDSHGKDTNNSSNGNDSEATLTFKDGNSVPMTTDSKGRPTPDYGKMTAEQAADVMTQQFGEDAEKVADARIKKAEKAVKDAEKMKVDYSGEDADIIEQEQVKNATIAAAHAQLEKAKAIKEALTKPKESVAGGEVDTTGRYEQERKQGYRIGEGNVRYDRQKPEEVGGVRGKEIEVAFSPTEKVNGHAKLVELDTVQASHSNGTLNPYHFGPDWQPKDRGSQASKVEATKIAANIDPQQITGSNNAFIGSAPSVNERHETIQGNNRVEALKQMYSSHPEQAAKYKQWLIDHAAEFGLNPEDVAKMQKPVIVNELPVDDAKAKELGQMMASGFESGGKRIPEISATINKIGDKIENLANVLLTEGALGEDAKLSDLINQNANRALEYLNKNGFIDNTEYENLASDPTTKRQWLENVLKTSLFDGDRTTEAAFNSLPGNAQKAVLATFMRDMKSGKEDRIKPNIQKSFEAYNELSQLDAFKNAKNVEQARAAIQAELLNGSNNMYGEAPIRDKYTNFELELAALYKGLKDQKTLTGLFGKFFDAVQGATKRDMFEEGNAEPLSKDEAIEKVFGTNNKLANDRRRETEPPAPSGEGDGNRNGEPEQSESQERVNEALNHIATEITKQTGIEVVTDEKVGQSTLEDAEATDSNIKYHKETDQDILDELNSGETIKVYRAMQVIDGKLYPPMAASVGGKLVEANELGTWIRADENPDLAIPDIDPKTGQQKVDKKTGELKWKFKLDKGGKDATGKKATDVNAAYNPYWHMSRSPLNDQFKSAWIRPNIVVVECEVPVSELTSGYKAERAKDAVGEVDWKSGSVSGEVFKQTGRARKVILSRWCKPVRVLDDAEVAQRAKEFVGDTKVEIPENVLTPKQRIAFEEAGFKIGAPEKGVKKSEQILEALEKGLQVDNTVKEQREAHSSQTGFDSKDQELFDSLNDKRNTRKEYNDTVTELANRMAERGSIPTEGTAGRNGETEESVSSRRKDWRGASMGRSDVSFNIRPKSVAHCAADIITNDVIRRGRTQRLSSTRTGLELGQKGSLEDGSNVTTRKISSWGLTGQRVASVGEREVSSRIESWAKQNNAWFDWRNLRGRFDRNKRLGTGDEAESDVFLSKDGKTVLKIVRNPHAIYDTLQKKLDSIAFHNELFPTDAMNVIGFTKINEDGISTTSVLLEQPFAEGKTVYDSFATSEEKKKFIDNFMEGLGFSKEKWAATSGDFEGFPDDIWRKGDYAVSDVNAGNVIIDKNGKGHIIDCVVEKYEDAIKDKKIYDSTAEKKEIEAAKKEEVKRLKKERDNQQLRLKVLQEARNKNNNAKLDEFIADAKNQIADFEKQIKKLEPTSSEQSGSKIKEFRSKNGEVYGFTVDGKIYLDTKKMKPETPLHEYTHLWTAALKRANPKEWENVKKLFDEVEGLKEEVSKLYPELKGDDLYEEMITTYSGREGAKKLEEVVRGLASKEGKTVEESSKAQGFLDKVKTALQKYWKGVADMLHIHFTSAEEVADKVLADWAKGVNPKDVKATEGKPEPSKDPIEGLNKAAEGYNESKLDAARKAYEEAKKSGDESEIKRTRDELKQKLDEKYKAQGMGLIARRKEIAKEIGKAEAAKIDKPWSEMDLEEREVVSSKNPLTEDEINELTSEENRELIPAALAYLRGDKGNIVNAISYFKIWNDVRNRHENAPDNSGAEDGTQLAATSTTGGEGLGLGAGRDSRGTDGQLDRGTGEEPSSRERTSGEGDKTDPATPAGEPSDKQGEGNTPGMGAVPARGADTKGGSAAGTDGNKPQRGGRKGGNRPAKPDAKRKPAAKQGTHFPNSTTEQLKKERAEYEKKKADFWARWKKAGQGYAKIALTPFKRLNLTPEQIEMLPELFKMHLNGAVLKIKEGIFKFKEWKAAMMNEAGEELKMIGLTDDDVDRFMDDYWNTPFEMDGESHTISEWAGIYGNEKLREKIKEPLNEKYQKQMAAEPIKVKVGDMKNIEETLPYLLPQQQEDVLKAETQFFGKKHTDRDHAYGKGYMFTNGTGTGKTYTGLGIAKRLAKQGKGRILFVTPSQKKVADWVKDGKNLGLDIRDLDSVAKEKGTTATTESGEGMVITTYANMRANKKLLETEWDAVIYDESHRIMENKKGAETAGSQQHYMLTNRDENHTFLRLQSINKHYQKMQSAIDKFNDLRQKEIARIQKEYKQSHPSATAKDIINATYSKQPKDLHSFAPADGMTFPKLGKAYQDFTQAREHYLKNVEPKLKEQAKQTWKNTKTVFLSATPFNTRENLDYAEGYIFKFPENNGNGRIDPRSQFYLDHFGAAYRFRYNRLEAKTDNPDAVAKQEIAFSDYLQNTLGTMSGRIIDSAYDYSRDFPTVAPDHAEDFNNATQEAMTGRYLGEAYRKTIGNYNYGSALFETMKIANIIGRMKEHLDAGRKIVVFHRRVETKEPIQPPFAYMLSYANAMIKEMKPGKEKEEAIAEANEFRRKYADLLQWEQTLDYSMPREQIAKAFGKDNVLFFSGKESKGAKSKAVDVFNDDNSGKNIIVIQEASGKEGISLHDTTGNHQRVLITLGLPQSPITALQIEGRTYRIGNKSNAIFEYPILGLNSEMMLFGEKFNNQVSTTENLALGSKARNLRDSFANGVLEHSGIVPIDQQGVGGKEFDAPKQSDTDPFDDAVLDYYSNQKLNKRNREGVDYFPTPEPLGYKMVEWANMGEGDTALEPSAGHGAIARYIPRENQLLSIEPSQSLFTKLQLKAGGLGRKFLNNMFENYDVSNKHDVVVMNPPFGTAGATAIAHLDKAFRHLDEGGRVVAIIPRGSTDKKFDKWYDGQKNIAMRAEVDLPDIVFQQAGTSVRCRVVVLDKITDAALRSKAGYPEKIDLSGHYDKIEDFFEDLRDVQIPDRIIDTQLKDMKKARSFKKELESIKGISVNYADKNGISVFDKNCYRDYSITFPSGNHSKEWLKENYSKVYEQFDQTQQVVYSENSKAALEEMKKLACKLADMSEDEMQKYIGDRKNGGTDGKVHFRTEENAGNENSSEKLFLSLQQKSNNKKEYNDTVTELANRVKQGTARIVREGEEAERDRSKSESIPAIVGKILNGIHSQGIGENRGVDRNSRTTNNEKWTEEKSSYHVAFGRLEDWAKENNCYYTEDSIAKDSLDGEMWKDGFEAYVYRSKDGKSVIKVMGNCLVYKDPIDYHLERNRYFNEVFPDTAIEVIGYGKDRGGYDAIIYKQPLVEGTTVYEHFGKDKDKSYAYIDKYMESLGYKVTTIEREGMEMDAYTNGKYNIFDVNYENVIIDKDGNPHVIDAEVLPIDYKNDGKIEIKDTDTDTHFKSENNSSVKVSDHAPIVVKHIANVAEKVGGKVNMVQSAEEVTNPQAKKAIEEGEPVTGWYDEKTGEVHLYMPNIHDRYTAEKTIWHEVVGHKGMRELFGEDRFDKFLDSVWYDLDKPENASLKKLVMEEIQKNPFDYRNAIEEGVARLAEEGRGDAGFWRNIKNKVTDFLHEIGYRIAPNTKDVKYLLWLSKNMQKNPNDPYYKMRAEAVKYHIDHEDIPSVIERGGMFHDNTGRIYNDMSELPKAEYLEMTDGKVHFRTTPSTGTALDRYERALNAHGYMATESFMDNMLSLKELMMAVDPSIKKIEDVKSSENPYILQNTMQGAMSNAAQMFERNVMKPLDKAMADVLDAFDGKKDEEKIRNFNLYMITKHGLERNRVFFVRDYITKLKADQKTVQDAEILQKQWDAEKKDLGDKLRNGSIDLKEYYEEMDEWIRNSVDKDFKAEEHDYSGMHGLQEIDDNKAPYDDAAAIQSVMDSEANMESVKAGSVKDFWSKVHAATSYSLYCDYANGFQSRETYTKTSQMFDWYVPLRKFDEQTAEDVYGYVTEKGDPSGYIGSVLMSAKGRKSLSEVNVLAQIGAMGNMAISNGGKNAIKQAFMRFARSHDSQGLITEGQVWLVKDGTNADGSDRWVEAYPQIPDGAAPKTVSNAIRQFEADMKAKQATGNAKIMRNAADIGYKFERAKDKSQHVVDVKVNGKTHRFYINGNPRAAQALNGMLENWNGSRSNKYVRGAMQVNAKITRFFAQACTSFSPEFVARNLVKDYEFSTLNLLAKEGTKYTGVFEKYYFGLVPFNGMKNISMSDLKGSNGFGLFAKYRKGTLNMNNKVERYFNEFMKNGGATGFVQMLGMKDWTKKYKAEIKLKTSNRSKVAKIIKDGVFGNIEGINEVAENMARFATYCASRDSGRSIVHSAYDAKEVTINFNRQGSGSAIGSFRNGEMSGFKEFRKDVYGFTSCYLRNMSMFFNAGIQSTNLLLKNAKSNPIGTGAYIATGPMILAALIPLVNQSLMAMLDDDEKDRNGVKDPYAELPDYVRRNNLCIYTGGGEFVTIPLAIETRAFYGLGDLAADLVQHPEDRNVGDIARQATGQIAQLVPVMDYMGTKDFGENPLEASFQAFTPSSIELFVEWERNKDWKGQQIERRGEFYKNDPAWERANSGTNSTLMKLNQYVNAQTNDVAKGNPEMLGNRGVDWITNPSMWEHYGAGVTKGMGTFGSKIAGVIKKGLITHEEIETKDIPFLRSFLYTPSETSSMQRTKSKFYNYADELDKDLANVKKLKSGTKDPSKAFQNASDYYNFYNSNKSQQIQILERANKQIKNIKKMRNKQTDTEVIRWADQQIGLIMQEAVERMDKLN